MENNQSTQQSSESSPQETQPAGLNPLLKLLKRYPWLVLSGVWAFLLASATISVVSLTQANRVEQQPTTPVAAKNLDKTISETGNSTPLWLLGAVALTCAAGSLVIFKRLTSSPRTTRVRRRRQAPPLPTPLEEPPPPIVPVSSETEPVDILQSEQNYPLDASEESLAEMMDIRKQRSLSSFLSESQQEKD